MAALRVADLAKIVDELKDENKQIVDNANKHADCINRLQSEITAVKKMLYGVGIVAVTTGIYSLASLMSLV
jgi:hypothetical protein